MADKKISTFKKFSEMNEDSFSIEPEDFTGMPNLPKSSTKSAEAQSTRYMKPKAQTPEGNDYTVDDEDDKYKFVNNGQMKYDDEKNENVEFIGKVAKLPKGVKASKGLNFMENVKIPKSSIWYIMVEKQDSELQMIKYNLTKGFNLAQFTNDLKGYYAHRFQKSPNLVKLIENIQIDGNDKWSWIKNIPLIELEGKKLITIITEDIIKLLSK
jgi:hypothetical protein